MKIKIAADDSQSMAQSGDSILRSLQNTDLSYADVVVRESLQNALDATLPDADRTIVNFDLKEFDSEELSAYFEGIQDELLKNHAGRQKYLAISDKHTYGLTGDYLSNDSKVLDSSNFQKLVFSIGKNQDHDGAGGSWGMGKTSFFRIGVGIVLYYTRIKLESGEYEERLVASLIEDPKKEDRLLKASSRGIAWWGRYEDGNDKLLPITDHEEIKNILQIFGLQNYQDDDTGTVILIPYLRDGLVRADENGSERQVPWNRSFADAIQMAAQRWYAPRICNPIYSEVTGNSDLLCHVNGENIFPLDYTFQIMQNLYNAAATGKADKGSRIVIKEIRLAKRAFSKNDALAGRVAFVQPTDEELGIAGQNRFAPYSYITSELADEASPKRILAYTRKPGMVIRYDIDGKWTYGVKCDGNLLAFFVPKSDQKMTRPLQEQGYDNLEQYLRNSEKADHAEWFDVANKSVVKRITAKTAEAIRDSLRNKNEDTNVHMSDRLARRFGSLVPKARGEAASVPRKNSSGKKKEKTVHIKVDDTQQVGTDKFQLSFSGYVRNKAKISLGVLTQEGRLTAENWAKSFDKLDFPVTVVGFSPVEFEGIEWELQDGNILLDAETAGAFSGKMTVKLASFDYRINIAIKQIK